MELIKKLIQSRCAHAKALADLKAAQDDFKVANKKLFELVEESRLQEAQDEVNLRDAIKTCYQETGNKKPFPGCGVRIASRLKYDPARALQWAKDHLLCLSLDSKAFESIAKTQSLEFVETEETITPTIATDLAKAVEV